MIFEVPTSTTIPAYRQRVTLDGVTFVFRFRFNTRINSWLIDIFREDDTPVVVGRRCLIDWLLLRQHSYKEDAPAGHLTVFDTTARKEPPLIDDFGERVLLLYSDAAELAEVLSG